MTPGNRRLVVRAVVVLALLAGVAGVWAAIPILRIGVGHKAKTLCSGVFVAGRAPAAVLADLQVDDLALLRYVDAHVDYTERTVTAEARGLSAWPRVRARTRWTDPAGGAGGRPCKRCERQRNIRPVAE
jgi:hypothetical protein